VRRLVGVQFGAQAQQRVDLCRAPQVEVRRGLLALQQPSGNGTARAAVRRSVNAAVLTTAGSAAAGAGSAARPASAASTSRLVIREFGRCR